jgi:hypothetical protein
MHKRFLMLLLLIVSGTVVFLLWSDSEIPNHLDKSLESTIISSPKTDFSQGATIDVKGPNDIQQWVSEIRNMILIHTFAYIATENYGLQVLDVSDPTHPLGVASIYFHTQVFKQYSPSSLFWTGEHLYVGASCTGGMLFILDLAQPAAPTLLDAHYLTCSGRIYVADHKAYVANHYSGLLVLDVSNPTDVKEYGSVDVLDLVSTKPSYRQSIPPVTELAVYKDNVLITVLGFEPTMLKLDTSNPATMVVTSKRKGKSGLKIGFNPYIHYEDTLYISTKEGIIGVPIEFGSSPTLLLPADQYSHTDASITPNLFITQNRLYLISPQIGLQIFDIADHNMVKLVGSYQPLLTTLSQVIVTNDEIALVAGAHTLQILDVKAQPPYKLLFSTP